MPPSAITLTYTRFYGFHFQISGLHVLDQVLPGVLPAADAAVRMTNCMCSADFADLENISKPEIINERRLKI